VTRDLVIAIARARGVRVRERSITLREMTDADEAFLTSSLVEVVPIVAVADAIIGSGRRGRRTRDMQRACRALRRTPGS
jgi:branched-subunit amino acid aminotransferase/4-amino-4-deoxychorismate lyase